MTLGGGGGWVTCAGCGGVARVCDEGHRGSKFMTCSFASIHSASQYTFPATPDTDLYLYTIVHVCVHMWCICNPSFLESLHIR